MRNLVKFIYQPMAGLTSFTNLLDQLVGDDCRGVR
jgi:hypothetical protein